MQPRAAEEREERVNTARQSAQAATVPQCRPAALSDWQSCNTAKCASGVGEGGGGLPHCRSQSK